EACLREGFTPPNLSGGKGSALEEACRRLSLSSGTIYKSIQTEKKKQLRGEESYVPDWAIYQDAPIEIAAQSRSELHDAAFWRNRHSALQKELAAAEHLAEQLAGLRGVPFSIPKWIMDANNGPRGRSVIGALVSDVHMGEVIDAEEILGINAFDPDICRKRLRRYFDAVCTIGQRWASDTDCEGVLLALAGDLVSGDIHEEIRITNAITSQEQILGAASAIGAGISALLETYGRVHVIGVPGNHGRPTIKPTAKLYARLSYDSLVVSMIAGKFASDERVTFQSGKSTDQITPIFGRTVFTSHGDKMGSGGGMGFAGPILPIVRGTKKVQAQQSAIGRAPNLILHGHYHTTANPGNVLSNGSVPGYSEFGNDLRGVVEPPQQWAFLLHSKWFLRERMPIQLEDPQVAAKPVVRIPAGMVAA
ncbi:MAG: hypothetical protein KGL39_57700, partial [Patescibacteria group bacterium]|nr:hypothetical protein [Patescibacteria group bacterium]